MTVRRSLLALPAALLLALVACGDTEPSARTVGPAGPTEPSVAAQVELTRSGGCGDAYLWAATADGRLAVALAVDARERSTADVTTLALDLPDPEVEAVVLRAPGDLTRNFCVDVLEEESEPTSTVTVSAGEGEITLDPVPAAGPDRYSADCGETSGRAELTGVEAEDGTTFAPFTIETSAIGCYAG